MEPFSDQFLEFHHIHGSNVRLDPSCTQATRVESFANGVCFSSKPLNPGEIFLVEVEEKELGWCGHLRIGLTGRDPSALEVVPEYSLPDLVDLGVVSSLQTLCRKCIQKHIVHRMALDWLELPERLKHFCKYE